MRISLGKSRDYRFLKSMEDTFIRLYVLFLNLFYFLAEGSVAEVKAAQIWANQKGGYAHK